MRNRNHRLCIYFFYDQNGIADRYVDYFLADLRQMVDRLVVVSNGLLTQQAKEVFAKYTTEVWERENIGFDVWAYKTTLERIGWPELRQYYEVILANSTIMGPVYSFSEMFEAMARRAELDFWGITGYGNYKAYSDLGAHNPYGYLPEHIQSHFTVYRNKFLQRPELEEYWDRMPMISSYEEAVGRHESYFTKYFADLGFQWDTYIHTPGGDNYTTYYLMMDPVRAIRDDRCPVFKRRSFFLPKDVYLAESAGEQPWELYRYLKENTDYDTDMILENLLRTCHQDDIVRNLRLEYVLPCREVLPSAMDGLRTAGVIHLYYMDLLQESFRYVSSFPGEVDIYITTASESNAEQIRSVFSKLPNRLEIRIVENRGRDVSALLVGARDLQEKYDLICFYHDKKTLQAKPWTMGKSFSYMAGECALSSEAYVRNIIHVFAQNPRLGFLTNPPPNHAGFLSTLSNEWGDNFEIVKKLVSEFALSVPVAAEHVPVAPLGTVFWYRTKALLPLFQKEWQYQDFPPEPNKNDGTLLHAIERFYPFVIQNAGYYPGYVMPDHVAALEMDNLRYYVSAYNLARMVNGIDGSFHWVIGAERRLLKPAGFMFRRISSCRSVLENHLPKSTFKMILKMKRAIFHQVNTQE